MENSRGPLQKIKELKIVKFFTDVPNRERRDATRLMALGLFATTLASCAPALAKVTSIVTTEGSNNQAVTTEGVPTAIGTPDIRERAKPLTEKPLNNFLKGLNTYNRKKIADTINGGTISNVFINAGQYYPLRLLSAGATYEQEIIQGNDGQIYMLFTDAQTNAQRMAKLKVAGNGDALGIDVVTHNLVFRSSGLYKLEGNDLIASDSSGTMSVTNQGKLENLVFEESYKPETAIAYKGKVNVLNINDPEKIQVEIQASEQSLGSKVLADIIPVKNPVLLDQKVDGYYFEEIKDKIPLVPIIPQDLLDVQLVKDSSKLATRFNQDSKRVQAVNEQGVLVAEAAWIEKTQVDGSKKFVWEWGAPFMKLESGTELRSPTEKLKNESIGPFVNAMNAAGFKVTGEQVSAGITYQENKDKNGNSFVVATYNLDPDPTKTGEAFEGEIPLLTYENGVWSMTLKPHAENAGIEIGTQVVEYGVDKENYSATQSSQFSLATINGETCDPQLWPKNGFNFSQYDKVMNYVMSNGMSAQVNNIIYEDIRFVPEWLKKSNFTKEQYLNIYKDHIKSIVQRYNGKIEVYVVVNEALNWNKLYGFWFEKIGPDFIDIAFQITHEVDPNAKLIYNDSNEGTNGGIDEHENAVYTLVKRLKNKGVPIDGVGMQMHINPSRPFNKEAIKRNMQRYKELGLKVYITEFDVFTDKMGGSAEEKQRKKAQIYVDSLSALVESGAGNSFAIFGLNPNYSWKPESDGLIYDKDGNPNLSYFALLQYLYQLSNK